MREKGSLHLIAKDLETMASESELRDLIAAAFGRRLRQEYLLDLYDAARVASSPQL